MQNENSKRRRSSIAFLAAWIVLFCPLPRAAEVWSPDAEELRKVSEISGKSLSQVREEAVGTAFAEPETCQACHPRQYREWNGSSHSYAAFSPTFNTFEMISERATDGRFANNGVQRNFCRKCHTPLAEILGEFADYVNDASVAPMRDSLSAVTGRGVSCEVCHRSMSMNHARVVEEGRLGDGVANTSLVHDTTTGMRRGPIDNPIANGFHPSGSAEHFKSATICGGCHDVRIGHATDAIAGEPFLRLENLFSEFMAGPYANLAHPRREAMEARHPRMKGRVGKCQDCHMSLYPVGDVAQYPTNLAAADWTGAATRTVATHYFTGADIALVDFPAQDDPTVDEYGMPRGLKQRRRLLVQRAVEMSLSETPAVVAGATLPLRITLTNVSCGHRVVSGFSQERQMWLEATVVDATSRELFSTGYLRRFDADTMEFLEDPDGDGEHDEDWANNGIAYAGGGGETPILPAIEVEGPDRHLTTFTNHFEYVDGNGKHHEVHLPFAPNNHMNNWRTLPPFEPQTVAFNVPIPSDAEGPLSISVRLRFRHFPPVFLRYLTIHPGSLVDESMLDRLEIIEMAQARREIALAPVADLNGDGRVDRTDLLILQSHWGAETE